MDRGRGDPGRSADAALHRRPRPAARPRVAREAGLPSPILHGLCTYGIAGRVLLRAVCGNDPARVARLDARFTAPVLPGDALRIAVWNEGDGAAAFRVEVPARGVTAINNGYLEVRN